MAKWLKRKKKKIPFSFWILNPVLFDNCHGRYLFAHAELLSLVQCGHQQYQQGHENRLIENGEPNKKKLRKADYKIEERAVLGRLQNSFFNRMKINKRKWISEEWMAGTGGGGGKRHAKADHVALSALGRQIKATPPPRYSQPK